jgi:hypothetical protein
LITNVLRPTARQPAAVVCGGLLVLLLGCGSSAGSPAPSSPVAGTPAATPTASTGGDDIEPSEPAATSGGGGSGASSDAGGSNGPIGGDLGDRSKGSIQATVSGGLTASIDLPYAPALARLLTDGPKTGYLPFTDPTNGTVFLTITDGGLLVQYVGPDQVGLANGATPCDLHLDTLDATGAKGSFTCKGMLLVKNDSMGSADMTASFEGHQ